MELSAKPNFTLLIALLNQYRNDLQDDNATMRLSVFRLIHDSDQFDARQYNNFKLALYAMLTDINVTVSTSQLIMLLPNVQPRNDLNDPDISLDSIFKYAHGSNDTIFMTADFDRFDLKVLIEQINKLSIAQSKIDN